MRNIFKEDKKIDKDNELEQKQNEDELIDKLEVEIYPPCKGLILKHVVELARKDKDKSRRYFYQEVKYQSTKYVNYNELIKVKIKFKPYLSLEMIDGSWNENIYLDYKTIPSLKYTLNEVFKWFTEEDYYSSINNKLILSAEGKAREEIFVSYNNVIKFKPALLYIEDEDNYYQGINIMINKEVNVYSMFLDELIAFKYFIDDFNLYKSSMDLINLQGRPEIGKYQYVASNSYKNKDQEAAFKEFTKDTVKARDISQSMQKDEDLSSLFIDLKKDNGREKIIIELF